MSTRWVIGLTVSMLLALLWVAGCGQRAMPAPAPAFTPLPTSTPMSPPPTVAAVLQLITTLHVQSTATSFDMTVTDAPKIQRLYQAIQDLPAIPAPPLACPPDVDQNNEYLLTFNTGETITIQSSGCQWVRIDGGHGWMKWVLTTPQFWPQFADTLGVPESAVYPVPRQPDWPPVLTATP
jgi:hypothetical protein